MALLVGRRAASVSRGVEKEGKKERGTRGSEGERRKQKR